MKLLSLLFILIFLLIACRPGEATIPTLVTPNPIPVVSDTPTITPTMPSVTATSTHTPLPTATSTPESTPTPIPIAFALPGFIFQGSEPDRPVVSRNPSPAIRNLYINPGAVLFHDNQFHMFFNSFTGWPSIIKVGYMTSADGYQWQMAQEEPVFTTDQVPFGSGFADVSSVVVLDDGTWVIYFHTIQNGQIGLATAASPFGPWNVETEPILMAGSEDTWDKGGLYWPNVIRNGDTYHMYYGGKAGLTKAIGLATSPDGRHWTKYDDPATSDPPFQESDPVLAASESWESNVVDRPRVQLTPDGWVMIFAGAAIEERGLALSEDGIHWAAYTGNPILTPEQFPISRAKTWDTALLFHDNAYYYFMEIGTLDGTDLYLAVHNGPLRQ